MIRNTIARVIGGGLVIGGLVGALYSNAQWKELDKRVDIVEFRAFESDLLARNLLIEKDSKYRINPPDTTGTLEDYMQDSYDIFGYQNDMNDMPLMFGILESAMYKERQNIYAGLAEIGAALVGASFLKRRKSHSP